jgi:hypothetical protein
VDRNEVGRFVAIARRAWAIPRHRLAERLRRADQYGPFGAGMQIASESPVTKFERELSATPTESFPVGIVMERKDVRRGAWSVPSWRALAVLTGERLADQPRQKTLLQSADGVNQYLCSGFRIDLYRDAAEHYWFNLTGGRPALFVLCRADENGELEPWRVTADHTESQSLVESGGVAFPAPIPPEVLEVLERFITEHFRPEPARKRRRERWTDSEKT